jgi:hypothetical protein
VRDDHGKRGLAQAGRTCQEDVIRSSSLQGRSLQKQSELAANLGLPDKFGK